MAATPTLFASGTQSATLNVEHTLLSTTAQGVYVFKVDANALAAGDTLNLYVKTKILSGGTIRGEYTQSFYGPLSTSDQNLVSVPIVTDPGIQTDFSLQQIAGTGRSFPWKVVAL